jgi:hypothetical protein
MAFDAYFSNVSLLLHFDGSNGGTSFPDSSSNNVAITRSGATTETGTVLFGTASGDFSTGTRYLTAVASALFGFGTGDFTLELWLYWSSGAGNETLVDFRASDIATPLLFGITSAGAARTYDGVTVRTGGTINASAGNHLAWVRASNVNTVYVNGVSGHTWTESRDFGSSKPLCIGVNVSKTTEIFNGYLDELRITKGVARYTGTFTPPTAAFPDSGPPPIPIPLPTFGQLAAQQAGLINATSI